jgi:hypothetical protein
MSYKEWFIPPKSQTPLLDLWYYCSSVGLRKKSIPSDLFDKFSDLAFTYLVEEVSEKDQETGLKYYGILESGDPCCDELTSHLANRCFGVNHASSR